MKKVYGRIVLSFCMIALLAGAAFGYAELAYQNTTNVTKTNTTNATNATNVTVGATYTPAVTKTTVIPAETTVPVRTARPVETTETPKETPKETPGFGILVTIGILSIVYIFGRFGMRR